MPPRSSNYTSCFDAFFQGWCSRSTTTHHTTLYSTKSDEKEDSLPIPPGKSLAHHHIKAHNIVYCSLYIQQICSTTRWGYMEWGSMLFLPWLVTLVPSNQECQPISHGFMLFFFFHPKPCFSNRAMILVTYNDKTCDLCWIWYHIHAPRTSLSMAIALKYYASDYNFHTTWQYCTVTKGCTDARVNIGWGSQHCIQCYRNVDSSIGCKLT